MDNFKIENPVFVDLEKTVVRFTMIYENGTTTVAELKVPKNREKGVNPHWDRILEEFDVEKMRKNRNDLEIRRRQIDDFNNKKRKAAIENDKLSNLFNNKIKLFDLPFVAEATSEMKSSIRRAPNELMLNIVLLQLVTDYMTKNEMNFLDLFDMMEEVEETKDKL